MSRSASTDVRVGEAPRWILVNGKRVHACVTCRALPEMPADLSTIDVDQEYRPKDARPAPHGGPRSARCTSHYRAKRRHDKQRGRDAYQMKIYGLPNEVVAAIEVEQGGRCPCGNIAKQTDHDHVKAAEHDHPEDRGCPDCVRGRLCAHCNREIIGYLSSAGRTWEQIRTGEGVQPDAEVAAKLRALADYLDDPPAQRVVARMRAAS